MLKKYLNTFYKYFICGPMRKFHIYYYEITMFVYNYILKIPAFGLHIHTYSIINLKERRLIILTKKSLILSHVTD